MLHQNAMGDTPLACFGQIPWFDHQGVQQAWRQQSTDVDNNSDDGDSNGSGANDEDDSNDSKNNEGEVDSNGGVNDN